MMCSVLLGNAILLSTSFLQNSYTIKSVSNQLTEKDLNVFGWQLF